MAKNSNYDKAIPAIVAPGDRIIFDTDNGIKVVEYNGDRMRVAITGEFHIERRTLKGRRL